MIDNFGIDIASESVERNITRLTNQIWKLIPMKEENILKITVKDEGKGVENYAKERLFERFFSCPRPDTNIKSTGLGLSLVAEIAKLHGGEITLENHPQGGAIATLKIALKNN